MIFEELDKIQAPVENEIPSSHSQAGGQETALRCPSSYWK